MPDTMTSNRPYLVRAIHQWIVDNGLTTHLLVNAEYPGVNVPQAYVDNGQIVLNIAPRAVYGFVADNEEIRFSARFGGQPMQVRVPMPAVLAVFARENGQGMVFEAAPTPQSPPPGNSDPTRPATAGKPSLKVIK